LNIYEQQSMVSWRRGFAFVLKNTSLIGLVRNFRIFFCTAESITHTFMFTTDIAQIGCVQLELWCISMLFVCLCRPWTPFSGDISATFDHIWTTFSTSDRIDETNFRNPFFPVWGSPYGIADTCLFETHKIGTPSDYMLSIGTIGLHENCCSSRLCTGFRKFCRFGQARPTLRTSGKFHDSRVRYPHIAEIITF